VRERLALETSLPTSSSRPAGWLGAGRRGPPGGSRLPPNL